VILSLVISSVLSTYLILSNEHIVSWILRLIRKKPRAGEAIPDAIPKGLGKEIVLLGFFKEASSFLHQVNQEMPYLKDRMFVIDFNPQTLEILKKNGVSCVYGDIAHPETLRHAGIDGAKVVISTISDTFLKGTTNFKLLKQIKKLCPESRIIVTSDTINGARVLYQEGADYVLLPRLLYAKHLFDIVHTHLIHGLETIREEQLNALSGKTEKPRL